MLVYHCRDTLALKGFPDGERLRDQLAGCAERHVEFGFRYNAQDASEANPRNLG